MTVELERFDHKLHAFLDTLQDSFFEADTGGFITYVNQAFLQYVGYTEKKDVIGKHFRHFTDRKSIREIYDRFNKVITTRKPQPQMRYYYRRKDGRVFIAETLVSPIIEGGEVVGTRGTLREITDRVRTEEEIENRARELASLNRISVMVNQSLDLHEIAQALCRELTQIFPLRHACVGLLDAAGDSLDVAAFHSTDPDEPGALGLQIALEDSPPYREVIDKRRTIVAQDAQPCFQPGSTAAPPDQEETIPNMIVPLLVRGSAIGTISMPAKNSTYAFSQREIELAETIASQIASAIDNARLYAKTESALGIAERDLEIGSQIQSGFFPEKLPEIPGWETASHFEPARQVAGDFYDVFQFEGSNMTAFVIADVCDKGVGAALFMVLFRSLLRAFSKVHMDVQTVEEKLLQIVLSTNDYIAEIHDRSNMFATLFFGVLDPESAHFYYVNGGHEPPVILDKDGVVVKRLMPTGPAVGLFPAMDFRVNQIHFNPGDMLVGFTDGATDAKNKVGTLFSEERLLKNIAVPWTSLFSMFFELNTVLHDHIGGQQQFDDITLLSLRRNLTQDLASHAVCRVAEMSAVTDLRDFVEQAALYSGLQHDDVFAFKLAVEEVCSNIIQYGYAGMEPGLISLFFDVENGTARVTIRDDGKFFAPDQVPTPDIEADWQDREIGGLGLFFVREMMDTVVYDSPEDGMNRLILEKAING